MFSICSDTNLSFRQTTAIGLVNLNPFNKTSLWAFISLVSKLLGSSAIPWPFSAISFINSGFVEKNLGEYVVLC